MKKIVIATGVLVCFVVAISLSAQPLIKKMANAAFNWTETVFDFGSIKVNVPVNHTFTFKNHGDNPLVITSVQASCGCTVTEYSKDPIEPGAEGFVKATYNAAKTGVFNKTVTVNANTDDGPVQLTIKGTVIE
jgi:hypothetical protein